MEPSSRRGVRLPASLESVIEGLWKGCTADRSAYAPLRWKGQTGGYALQGKFPVPTRLPREVGLGGRNRSCTEPLDKERQGHEWSPHSGDQKR